MSVEQDSIDKTGMTRRAQHSYLRWACLSAVLGMPFKGGYSLL